MLLAERLESNRKGDLQAAGTSTVFPERSPGYFLRAWNAVVAANGIEAACSKDSEDGFREMQRSGRTAYSLHEPNDIEVSGKYSGLVKVYIQYLDETLAIEHKRHRQP